MQHTDLHQAEPIPEEARAYIDAMLKSGDLFRYHAAKDAPVTLLEQEFASLMGAKYALAVASCSAALFLTLKALDLPRDAKVLIPAFTFAAVPSAVVHANCIPVLVEVADNYRIDMDDFKAKFSDDIQAVLISHMRGHTSDMDKIKALCDAKNIPLIEDAAHSLGTTWAGQKIGTLGKVGCFSFQSYKMINGGEGGILITDDDDIIARCVIMSGAYESNWQKHGLDCNTFARYQNELPLYNTRMNNLSAAILRPQLPQLQRRIDDGLRNHDLMADMLNASPYLCVPEPLAPEKRAPDSIQFNLVDFSDSEAHDLIRTAFDLGVKVSVFGLHNGNARAFWNWRFLGEIPELPQTKAMLMRACDVRLPTTLTTEQVKSVADVILSAIDQVKLTQAA
ncbi:MAG: aminotransferase class I/II-fold pyridoxal phosphate-dependent enzyme [Rhodobacterales bacterium]